MVLSLEDSYRVCPARELSPLGVLGDGVAGETVHLASSTGVVRLRVDLSAVFCSSPWTSWKPGDRAKDGFQNLQGKPTQPQAGFICVFVVFLCVLSFVSVLDLGGELTVIGQSIYLSEL